MTRGNGPAAPSTRPLPRALVMVVRASGRKEEDVVTLVDLLLLLFVAGLSGAVGQAIAGYSHGGCLVAVAVGFIGAVIGIWLARIMGLPSMFVLHFGPTSFPVVWAILGSALFVAVISALGRRW